jgi:hypothetical protein
MLSGQFADSRDVPEMRIAIEANAVEPRSLAFPAAQSFFLFFQNFACKRRFAGTNTVKRVAEASNAQSTLR